MEFETEVSAAAEGTTPSEQETGATSETKTTDTSPQGAEGADEESENGGEAADSSQQDSDNGQGEEEGSTAAQDEGIEITFNHQPVTLSREDTIKYAQMGKKLETLDPMLAKIDFLASVNNCKSREEYIEQLFGGYEKGLEQDIRSRFDGDEKTLADLIELEKSRNKKAYDDMISRSKAAEQEAEKNAREGTESRIAGEYAELTKEFPELAGKEFSALPKAVKQAAFGGTPLMTAYLLHKHREQKQAAAAAQDAEKQNKASVGSMSGGENENADDMAFLKGLWGK